MNQEKKHFFDNPRNLRRLVVGLVGLLVLLLAVEPFIHKHAYFAWEEWFGFYAFYGFVAGLLLVLIAKHILKPAVKRDEDYYD